MLTPFLCLFTLHVLVSCLFCCCWCCFGLLCFNIEFYLWDIWFHQSYLVILKANVELVAFQIQFVTMKWKASCPQIKTLGLTRNFCQWHNIHCSFINNTWWWKKHRINFPIECAPLYPFLLDMSDIYKLRVYLCTCNIAIKKVITPGFIELVFQENERNMKQ